MKFIQKENYIYVFVPNINYANDTIIKCVGWNKKKKELRKYHYNLT